MTDVFGKILATLLCFIMLFVMPFTWVTLSNEMVARRTIMNEMQSFIDETIDSRQITDAQIEDFYLGISGLGPVCAVEIERYVRTVDPDPMNPGEVRVTYVFTENNRTFSQGDKVKVRVHAISYTGAERLLRSTVGLWLPTIDYTFAGRVR